MNDDKNDENDDKDIFVDGSGWPIDDSDWDYAAVVVEATNEPPPDLFRTHVLNARPDLAKLKPIMVDIVIRKWHNYFLDIHITRLSDQVIEFDSLMTVYESGGVNSVMPPDINSLFSQDPPPAYAEIGRLEEEE